MNTYQIIALFILAIIGGIYAAGQLALRFDSRTVRNFFIGAVPTFMIVWSLWVLFS